MEFVNRQKELKALEAQYQSGNGSLVVLYGRRRLGKTALINKFLKNKKNAVYFMADKEHPLLQVNKLKNLLAVHYRDAYLEKANFQYWDQVFEYILQKAPFDEKFILAIDEFQYLTMVDESVTSIIQRFWDLHFTNKNFMLILCGSHVTLMYTTTLAYASPLYGRRTCQMQLSPILFKWWDGFFGKQVTLQEQVEYYAITSGIPKYIEMLSRKGDVLKEIRAHFLDRNSFFYSEPRFLLAQDIQEQTIYFSIIRVIAEGEHKIGKIAGKLEMPASKISRYLDLLREIEVIERKVPVTEENPGKSRKGLYFIKDYYMRFWFRYVYPYQSYLEMDNKSYVMRKVKTDFNQYVSMVFEDICRQLVADYCPFLPMKIGSYWSQDIEIDVVAYNPETRQYLFGECKWTEEKVDTRVFYKLIEKVSQGNWLHEKRQDHYILFSKSGFDEKLEQLARIEDNIILIDFSAKKLPPFEDDAPA